MPNTDTGILDEKQIAEKRETIALRNGLEREVATNKFIDQLLKERAALRQSLAQVERENQTFRTRAIQFCRDKAAEWEGRTDQSMSSCALELGDQLEKL